MAQKVCKQCRIVVNGELCPLCKNLSLASATQGRVVILNAQKSEIAQKVGYPIEGEYVIKVR